MKFRVTMKDPDTLHYAVRDAVRDQLSETPRIDEEEKEMLEDARAKKIGNVCAKWFKYGEYLTVEIDTEAGTCTVVEQ